MRRGVREHLLIQPVDVAVDRARGQEYEIANEVEVRIRTAVDDRARSLDVDGRVGLVVLFARSLAHDACQVDDGDGSATTD